MQITGSQYKKWLNMSKVICSDDQMAQDILQDLLLYFLEKETPEEKINDNYIFMSLKNRFLTHLNKEKKTQVEFDTYKHQTWEEIDLDAIQEDEADALLMLESIKEVLGSLRSYEQKLWTLHHMYDLSQRYIARETGITHVAINKRINNIKEKIKLKYDGKKEKARRS